MPPTCGSETSATEPSPGTSDPSESSAPARACTPAALLEELGDGGAQILLEVAVEVDERPPETLGDLRTERRLARTHEADEREVAVQRVRGCQSIRSR